MTRKEMQKEVKKKLKYLEKRGLNIDLATKGKSVEQLAHNKNTFTNFLKGVERAKERPKILQDLKKYEEKKKDTFQKTKKDLRNTVKNQIEMAKLPQKVLKAIKSSGIKENFPQFANILGIKKEDELKKVKNKVEKSKPLALQVEEFTKTKAQEFLNKYFKEIKLSDDYQKRIDNVAESFSYDLPKLNDFMDKVTSQDFKIYADGNINLKYEDSESYFEMMKQRLEKMEQMRGIKYG